MLPRPETMRGDARCAYFIAKRSRLVSSYGVSASRFISRVITCCLKALYFALGHERGYERFSSGVGASETNANQTIRIASHMGRVFARDGLLRKCDEYLDPPVPRGLCLLTLLVGFGGLNRAVLESEGR
jgi:hypothetical protein